MRLQVGAPQATDLVGCANAYAINCCTCKPSEHYNHVLPFQCDASTVTFTSRLYLQATLAKNVHNQIGCIEYNHP
jgi:hypothetical protein